MGWLFLTAHPEVEAKRAVIDMSDLEADAVVKWQKKLYIPLFGLLAIGMPVLVPYYYWNENLWVALWTCFNFRFTTTLNIAFSVNSFAHLYGKRPYDKNISPVDNVPVSDSSMCVSQTIKKLYFFFFLGFNFSNGRRFIEIYTIEA